MLTLYMHILGQIIACLIYDLFKPCYFSTRSNTRAFVSNFAICCWDDHYRSFYVMPFVLASNYDTIYYLRLHVQSEEMLYGAFTLQGFEVC
jgi:hypothetical protein